MLTPPQSFIDFQNRTGSSRNIIVKLTDGTNTFYLGTGEAQLTDGHVYPLIQSFGGVSQQLDIFSKQWAVNTCQIIFSNTPYRQDSAGVWVRLSDELTGILFNDASVHLLCGENVTALSDCLTIFSAKVLETLYYDDNTLRLTLHDKTVINNFILPQNKIEDTYSAAPPESLPLKMPLVYGEFTTDFAEPKKSGLGLAVAIPVNKKFDDFVVSDHILDALTFAYLFMSENSDVAEYISPTLNVNSSGKGRITASGGLSQTWLYPVNIDDNKFSTSGLTYTDLLNMIDRDTTTSGIIRTNLELGDGTETPPKALQMLGFDSALLNLVVDQPQFGFKFSTYFVQVGGITIDFRVRRFYYFNGAKAGDIFVEQDMLSQASYDESPSFLTFTPLPTTIREAVYVTVEKAVFTGSGLDDLTSGGEYVAPDSTDMRYTLFLDNTGTPDQYKFRRESQSTGGGRSLVFDCETEPTPLLDGVQIEWGATIGHTQGNEWEIRVHPNGTVDAAVQTVGSGLDDLTSSGTFSGVSMGKNVDFVVEIDGVGTPNTFKWTKGGGGGATGVSITGSEQTLQDGVTIIFVETENHLITDKWTIRCNAGRDDMTAAGTYTGEEDALYKVQTDTEDNPIGTFKGDRYDVFRNGVKIRDFLVCSTSAFLIDRGVTVVFDDSQHHTLDCFWEIDCFSARKPNSSFMLGLLVTAAVNEGALSEGTSLGDIHETRMLIRFNAEGARPHFVECKGREYSSWITGRSSNYASGEIIEDPAGIIESILRDILGLVTVDINEVSFINSENTGVKARINLFSDNEFIVDDVIRRIAEQSTFAYVWTAAGKARLIPLNDASPTTDRTIPFSHIIDGRITVSQTSQIVNDITINSRWQEEYGAFADRDTFTDAPSQTSFGVRKYEANWPNVAGAAVTTLKDHYVDGANAIWVDAHNVLEIETAGFTNADLEIGDWIELDASSVDPQVLCFGISWAGKQFLVVGLIQNRDSTQIKAIELH